MAKPKPKGPTSLKRESDEKLAERVARLLSEMHACLKTNTAIDLGTPPHREITEALHRLIYEWDDDTEPRLQVRYGDGTSGEPFPVLGLRLPSGVAFQPDRALNLGTLSFRHLDYDRFVDHYLIRDRETRALTNGEIERLAYERMKDILDDPVLRGETHITIFQAGLEPLAVGMYRTLVEHLRARKQNGLGQLLVQPVFFVDDRSGQPKYDGPLWG